MCWSSSGRLSRCKRKRGPRLGRSHSAWASSCSASDAGQPEEAGNVTWLRDLDTALKTSRTTGKPVFALFQEIPGCAGCKQFADQLETNRQRLLGMGADFAR